MLSGVAAETTRIDVAVGCSTVGLGVTFFRVCVGAELRESVGVVGAAVALAEGSGVAVSSAGLGERAARRNGVGGAVGTTTGIGVYVRSPSGVAVAEFTAFRSSPRCVNAETSAPIPSPATTTPSARASVEKPLADFERFFDGVARRRGEFGTTVQRFYSIASSRLSAPKMKMDRVVATRKSPVMIRVPVPIDVGAVSASAAFALATPLSLAALIDLALRQALGPRAPEEKHQRTLAVTLEGIRSGRFIVEVDGRRFDSPERVVVCSGHANLRFFHADGVRS